MTTINWKIQLFHDHLSLNKLNKIHLHNYSFVIVNTKCNLASLLKIMSRALEYFLRKIKTCIVKIDIFL